MQGPTLGERLEETLRDAPRLPSPGLRHEVDLRAAFATGAERAEDWTRLCVAACDRGRAAEARMAYQNAPPRDRRFLLGKLTSIFGPDAVRGLAPPPSECTKRPFLDCVRYTFRAPNPAIMIVGALFFTVASALLPVMGFALGVAALGFHASLILLSTVNGYDDPPEPGDFPSFLFGSTVLPLTMLIGFLSIASVFGAACLVGKIVSIAFALGAALIVLVGPLFPLCIAAYVSCGGWRGLLPHVMFAPFLRAPLESLCVCVAADVLFAGGFTAFGASAERIWLAPVLAFAAQACFAAAARLLGLFARRRYLIDPEAG